MVAITIAAATTATATVATIPTTGTVAMDTTPDSIGRPTTGSTPEVLEWWGPGCQGPVWGRPTSLGAASVRAVSAGWPMHSEVAAVQLGVHPSGVWPTPWGPEGTRNTVCPPGKFRSASNITGVGHLQDSDRAHQSARGSQTAGGRMTGLKHRLSGLSHSWPANYSLTS
jgi:hypothetical protein